MPLHSLRWPLIYCCIFFQFDSSTTDWNSYVWTLKKMAKIKFVDIIIILTTSILDFSHWPPYYQLRDFVGKQDFGTLFCLAFSCLHCFRLMLGSYHLQHNKLTIGNTEPHTSLHWKCVLSNYWWSGDFTIHSLQSLVLGTKKEPSPGLAIFFVILLGNAKCTTLNCQQNATAGVVWGNFYVSCSYDTFISVMP